MQKHRRLFEGPMTERECRVTGARLWAIRTAPEGPCCFIFIGAVDWLDFNNINHSLSRA